MLSYQIAPREVNIAYVSNSGSFLDMINQYAICPFKGGVTSPYDRLKIYQEYIGQDLYKMHTIEVHNKEHCNVRVMDTIRRGFLMEPYESAYLESTLLNHRPVIDVDYFKAFKNLPSDGLADASLDILEINFKSTKNGQHPGRCELRVFVSINRGVRQSRK